jgi:cellulose synthase/poly-beta-1,6-N-acetylglucosamine synthase-like glycosyltransferase
MIFFFTLLLYTFCAVYVGILGAFAWGFMRILRAPIPSSSNLPTVTIIVPARNEEANIASCLHSIYANDYPTDRFEVVVVDDLSEDNTAHIVQKWADEHPNLHLLSMPENATRQQAHKKRALEKAVMHTHSELILTTDADCILPPRWIRTMVETFEDDTAFVAGSVAFPNALNAPTIAQGLEFLGLVAIGAGSIGIGQPTICNGANVAYRRQVFLDMKGFDGIDHLTSGDDDLLMQKIAASKKWKIKFCASVNATVLTNPVATLRGLINQRKRWASKGTVYPNKQNVALIGSIYFFFVFLLIGCLLLPFYPQLGISLAICFALKILVECAILIPATLHFRRLSWMLYFLPQQLIHVPYIVYIGFIAAFGGYQWKGRNIHR